MSSGTGFFGSPIYKKVMSKVYGIGAAVAIMGALFKIQHFPGASIMLTMGLGVEALIFFLSAFEPPHEMPDWSLVYPELVGLESHDDKSLMEGSSNVSIDASPIPEVYSLNRGGVGEQLDPEALSKLSVGLSSFAQTVDQLSEISGISEATSSYLASIKAATGSFDNLTAVQTQSTQEIKHASGALSESYSIAASAIAEEGVKVAGVLSKSGENVVETVQASGKQLVDSYQTIGKAINNQFEQISEIQTRTSQDIRQSSEALGESYAVAAKAVTDEGMKVAQALSKSGDNVVEAVQLSGKQLTDVYKNMEQSMSQQIAQISVGANMYNDNIQTANSNLSAINSVYELHLASINKQVNEVDKLAQTLGELNTIYGNMLSVMNR